MFFLQAFQIPVTIVVGSEILVVPKMTVDDFASWAEEIRETMTEQAYGHLEDDVKAQTMALHPVFPPTRYDIRTMAGTEKGMTRIASVTLQKAEVYEAVRKVKPAAKDKDGKVTRPESVTYDKGQKLPAKNEDWVNALIRSNTGRLAHLVAVVSDLNDNSMMLPPSIATLQDPDDESVREEKSNPLE